MQRHFGEEEKGNFNAELHYLQMLHSTVSRSRFNTNTSLHVRQKAKSQSPFSNETKSSLRKHNTDR